MHKASAQLLFAYANDAKKGKVQYELQLMVNDYTKDVTMDPKGNVLGVEEQVQPEALPANVLTSLRTQAGKGDITKIESSVKHDRIVAYEAQVASGKRHREIQVGQDGQKLNHEE